jgi:c-di-GMP-binding flagellar brake protein YcgR
MADTGHNIKLGDRVEVLRDDRRAVSTVEAITPAGRLIISEPMSGTNLLPLHKGDKLDVFVLQGSGMLNFVVTAEEFIKERGLRFVEVEIRSKITRLQRRDFVRLDTHLPLSIIPLPDAEQSKSLSDNEAVSIVTDRRMSGQVTEEEIIGAITLDISGGGIRFFAKNKMEIESVADCEVLLDDGDKVSATIRIILCERDKHEGNVIMRARFIGISEPLRDKIIKYIFAEQLKRRRAAKRLSD